MLALLLVLRGDLLRPLATAATHKPNCAISIAAEQVTPLAVSGTSDGPGIVLSVVQAQLAAINDKADEGNGDGRSARANLT